MNINLADLTLHINEDLDTERRAALEDSLRSLNGVVSVSNPNKTPHLTIVEYNPSVMDSQQLLQRVTDQGANAKLVGL